MVSLKLNCKVTRLVIAIKITFTLVKCLTFILLVLAINQLPKISLENLVLLLSNTFKSNWFTEIEKLLLKRSIKLGNVFTHIRYGVYFQIFEFSANVWVP